jgi:hypothetical protein
VARHAGGYFKLRVRTNFPFRSRHGAVSRGMIAPAGAAWTASTPNLLLLPSGAGGHDRNPDRLRVVAELPGYDGWLLGCRERGMLHGRRRVVVTPLMVQGAPAGTIGTALAAAGTLHGCDYVLAATDAGTP